MKVGKEWMGRFRIATIQCNYKEVARQLKEQFTYWPNDSQMLAEIIREITKNDKNMIPSE